MIIVEIAGYLGNDPEERFTPTGKRVISLRIGTRVRHNNQDVTVWWKVSIWGDRFDKMLPFLKKGSAVIVIGEMGKPETYISKDGSTQVSLTLNAEMIKFSPFGKGDRPQEGGQSGSYQSNASTGFTPHATESFAMMGAGSDTDDTITGDDLPF